MTAHVHLQRLIVMAAILVAVAGCGSDGNRKADADLPAPVPVTLQLLDISGPAATPDAEISALCWYGDFLVLVPQHPERFGDEHGEFGLFVLDRADIEAAIDGRRTEPLQPRRAVLQAPGLLQSLPGWDGLEAAAAVGDTVYLAVEASVDGQMVGYLLRGFLDRPDDMLRLTVDTERITPVPVPTSIPNMSQEALVLAPGRVGVLFEVNGVNVNPGAHMTVFDRDLEYRGSVPLEHVEFRITDACTPLADGTFWVINYHFPGESGKMESPDRRRAPLEQLLEMRFDGRRVVRSGRAPLDLRTDTKLPPRNWEAMVRLDDRGFLIMTDRYPSTLLAFVPLPADQPPTSGERP